MFLSYVYIVLNVVVLVGTCIWRSKSLPIIIKNELLKFESIFSFLPLHTCRVTKSQKKKKTGTDELKTVGEPCNIEWDCLSFENLSISVAGRWPISVIQSR